VSSVGVKKEDCFYTVLFSIGGPTRT